MGVRLGERRKEKKEMFKKIKRKEKPSGAAIRLRKRILASGTPCSNSTLIAIEALPS